jgi:hypothetical protein
MKQLAATAAALSLILFIFSSTAHAQSSPGKDALENLDKELSEAYVTKALGKLDASRPPRLKTRVVIEHSLLEGKGQFVSRTFRTFEQIERWLRSKEGEDGTPFREARPLLRCRRGVCDYDFDGGILHNHLYLRRFSYAYRNGRPYIKTLYLLDGD